MAIATHVRRRNAIQGYQTCWLHGVWQGKRTGIHRRCSWLNACVSVWVWEKMRRMTPSEGQRAPRYMIPLPPNGQIRTNSCSTPSNTPPFSCLRAGLFLFRAEQCAQTNSRDLDDLETNTGDITLGLTGTTETGDEDLVVLVDEVKTTVVGDEGGDLLTVLDELDTDTLSDSRVGLLGLNTDLLENDTLGLGRTTSGRGLVEVAEGTLLELSVGLLG